MIIAGVGFLLFLVMVPRPQDLGFADDEVGKESLTPKSFLQDLPNGNSETDPLLEDEEDGDKEEEPSHSVDVDVQVLLSYYCNAAIYVVRTIYIKNYLKVREGEEEAISFVGALSIPGVVEFSLR